MPHTIFLYAPYQITVHLLYRLMPEAQEMKAQRSKYLCEGDLMIIAEIIGGNPPE